MANKTVFVGCGDIATRAALKLQAGGKQVLAVRRNTSHLPQQLASESADVLNPDTLRFLHDPEPKNVVYSLAAGSFDEESYERAYITGLRNTLAACNKLSRLIFISSTAVYHQNDGSWVDESSPTTPQRFNGQIMLQAEKLAQDTGVGTALRLSGIYGPGRTRLIERVKNGNCTPSSRSSYTNRIHVQDCAGLLAHLLLQDKLPGIIIGSDSAPSTSEDTETFIAAQLGIEKSYADESHMRSKRIAGNKRCSNRLMLYTGFTLQYPNYQSGYSELINPD